MTVLKMNAGRRRQTEEKLVKIHLRVPESLWFRLDQAARANYRTIIQETLMRLERDERNHTEDTSA